MALLALLALQVGLSWWWMHRNGFLARPPVADGAFYRLEALDALRDIEANGAGAFVTGMWSNRWRVHPPLFARVAAVVALPVGEISLGVCFATSVMFGVLLSLGTWSLARFFVAPWGAVLAVLVTQSAPIVLENWTPFFNQAAVCAFAVWSWVFLLRSDLLRSWAPTLGFGFLAAMALLTKIVAPLYLVGGLVAVVVLRVREERRLRPALVSLLVAICPAALLAAPWYVRNLEPALDHGAMVMTGLAQGQEIADQALLSLGRWTYYPRAMLSQGYRWLLGVPVLLATLVLAARAVTRWRRARGISNHALVLLGAALGVWVLASLTTLFAGSFYMIAVIPLGATCLAWCVERVRPRGVRVVAIAVVLAAASWNQYLCHRSFVDDRQICEVAGIRIGVRTHTWLGWTAVAAGCYVRPDAEEWPNAEFAELVREHGTGRRPLVLIATRERFAHPWVGEPWMRYEARLRGFDFRTRLFRSDVPDVDTLLRDVEFVVLDETFVDLEKAQEFVRSVGAQPEVLARRRVTPVSTVSLLAVRR